MRCDGKGNRSLEKRPVKENSNAERGGGEETGESDRLDACDAMHLSCRINSSETLKHSSLGESEKEENIVYGGGDQGKRRGSRGNSLSSKVAPS